MVGKKGEVSLRSFLSQKQDHQVVSKVDSDPSPLLITRLGELLNFARSQFSQ